MNKLKDRGSLWVRTIVPNVQDFIVNVDDQLTPEREAEEAGQRG